MRLIGQLARMLYPSQRGLSLRFLTMGRLLLGMTAVLLAVMPITEHFWKFDGFLHGGPDFELSLLALLTLFCLVLLLAHGGKRTLTALLSVLHWLYGLDGEQAQTGLVHGSPAPTPCEACHGPQAGFAAFLQPLRI